MSDISEKQGWASPARSNKFHYFYGTRSLCMKWAWFGEVDADKGTGDRKEDCAECTRRAIKNGYIKRETTNDS